MKKSYSDILIEHLLSFDIFDFKPREDFDD